MWWNPRFVRRAPPTRLLDHPFDRPRVFTGGAMVDTGKWSIPFVRLRFDRDAAELSFRGFGWTRSPVWILRGEVDAIVCTRGSLWTPGVMFAADPGIFDGVVFWARDRPSLLDAFEAEGWPVERSPGAVRTSN